MKLATFATRELPHARLGIVRDDAIVDVELAARALNVAPFEQMLDLIEQLEQGMQTLHAITQKAGNRSFLDVRTFSEIGAAHKLSDCGFRAHTEAAQEYRVPRPQLRGTREESRPGRAGKRHRPCKTRYFLPKQLRPSMALTARL